MLTEEMKKELKDSFDASVEAKTKVQDVKIDELSKKLVDAEAKVKKIEDLKLDKNYQISKNLFPSKHVFNGKSYNMDTIGDLLNEQVYKSQLKDCFKIFGKDSEAYYNFKKWAIACLQASAFKSDYAIQESYQKFMSETKADMVEGTPSQGGYGVPVQYEPEFILLARNSSFALNECRVINVTTNSIKWAKELTGTAVYYPGENTAPTESTATQAQLSITILKAMILTEGVSSELISDSMFDFVGYLVSDMAYAMGQNVDDQVLNGTAGTWGANVGLLTNAIANVVTLSGNSFDNLTDTDLSDAASEISDEAENNAKFIMNKKLLHYIRTIKDSTGRNIFVPGNVIGAPATIWEVPVIKSSKATKIDGASTTFSVVGDLKQYIIARNPGTMGIESDPYANFDKDTIRFRLKDRHGLGIRRAGDFCRIATKA